VVNCIKLGHRIYARQALASFLPSAPVQQLFNVTGGLFVTFDVAGKVKKAVAHAEAAAEEKQQVSVRFQAS